MLTFAVIARTAAACSRPLGILIPHVVIVVMAVALVPIVAIGGLLSPQRYGTFANEVLDRLIEWSRSALGETAGKSDE